MPRIFDNIEARLLPALQEMLNTANCADFCGGYFNLRGWRELDPLVDRLQGTDDSRCRLLIGMQSYPDDELRAAYRLGSADEGMDNATVLRLEEARGRELSPAAHDRRSQ